MQRLRHDVAVPGVQLRHVGRDDVHAAMAVGQFQRGAGQRGRVGTEERAHQRTLATAYQRQRVGQIAVRHQGGHGAEHFSVVGAVRRVGLAGAQERGADAAGQRWVGVHQGELGAVKQDLGLGLQIRQPFTHAVQLGAVNQCAHAHAVIARIAHGGFGQARSNSGSGSVVTGLGHKDAANGGALLARLDGHLARHFFHQQVKGFAAGRGVGQQQGGVDAVGLNVDAHRVLHHGRVRANDGGGFGRAGERDHIHWLQRVQQAGRAAAHHRQGAGRKDAGLHHVLHHALGQPGGGGGRFDDHRHAREQRGRGFLPQAPGREVEGVDKQGQTANGREHVLRRKQRVFAQAGGLAIAHEVAVAQRFAQLGVGAQREDGAVNVHRRVGFDGAAVGGGDVVVGVAVGLQHLDRRCQQGSAFAVAQGAQGSAAVRAGKVKTAHQVQAGGVHAHQFGPQHGVGQRGACAAAVLPLATQVVGKKRACRLHKKALKS